MDLGSLTLPKSEWRKLAAALEARLAGQTSLFETEPHIAVATEQAMRNFNFRSLRKQDLDARETDKTWTSVDLQSVETMESRSLGPELVGHTMWQRLQTRRKGFGDSGWPEDHYPAGRLQKDEL